MKAHGQGGGLPETERERKKKKKPDGVTGQRGRN